MVGFLQANVLVETTAPFPTTKLRRLLNLTLNVQVAQVEVTKVKVKVRTPKNVLVVQASESQALHPQGRQAGPHAEIGLQVIVLVVMLVTTITPRVFVNSFNREIV